MRAHGDRLGRIDDRSAANGEDPVEVVLLAQGHALAHEPHFGVGAHSPEQNVLDTRVIKR